MVGSITAACVLFSLSLVPFAFCDDDVFSNSFLLLSLLFFYVSFSRALNDGLNGTEDRRDDIFPHSGVDVMSTRLKAHRTTTVYNARDSKEERDDDDESIFSFFFRKTRVHSILYYCLFFFVRIRIRRLKMSRLERRNECSLQSRKIQREHPQERHGGHKLLDER